MEQNILRRSLTEISNGHIFYAIGMMKEYADNYGVGQWRDELERISCDYELMLDYMGRGVIDPEREKVHSRISKRLERCIRNIMLSDKIKLSSFYIEAYNKAGGVTLETEQLRSVLENFVSEQAMTGLLGSDDEKTKSREIYENHIGQMSRFFHTIIVSTQWTDGMGKHIAEILSSPTIDSFDAQLLVSSISIAVMNHYDEQKTLALANIYRLSTDENIKQRALVGWAFATAMEGRTTEDVISLCNDNEVANELADMQKQVMFCLNADEDNQVIQQDIIPELMRNQNLNITRFGITEKEDDPMEDILNPSAADERMEKLESSMHRMEQMQKEGSDIYFGGFSQMKRFPFFNDMANWFWPFFIEHPAVQEALEKIGKADFLSDMLASGPFCESDKYSFLLTMKTVFERLPDNVREMLQGGYDLGSIVNDSDRNSAAYIRRMYLQDLYRFFRLNMHKSDIKSPFADANVYLFVANKTFAGTEIDNRLAELLFFMHKRKMKNAFMVLAKRFMDLEQNRFSTDFIHLSAIYYSEYANDSSKAMSILKEAWDNNKLDDDQMSLKILGRLSLLEKNFELAVACYLRLHDLYPDNRIYAQNYCVALMKQERYYDALNILYRLDYEHHSANTSRAMAWALMGDGKLEQAQALYDKLLLDESTAPEDFLNAAYCHWIQGETNTAVNLFVDYKEALGNRELSADWLTAEMENDSRMLARHGIKPVDMMLMSDLVEKKVRGTD
ncbi:MAG: tetratricopeptide repeat protein [Prevotella koreensis]|uniref:tetratricopeptide repeat protein n=1 Tax=Prevotella koreensis TaxID=2490854 RepID=UPI003F9F0735